VLHKRDIGRSEPIRQFEVKPAQSDDDHAELANDRDHITTV
jgi:hypothetical protein